MREWSWGLWMRGRGEGWVVGGWGRRRAGIAFVGGLHRAYVSHSHGYGQSPWFWVVWLFLINFIRNASFTAVPQPNQRAPLEQTFESSPLRDDALGYRGPRTQ